MSEQEKTVAFVKRIVKIVAGVVIGLVVIFNSIYITQEQEKAVLTTFGVPSLVENAGPHLKIPFVQEVRKVPTTIYGMQIGYNDAEEYIESESLMITSDFNFVNVDFYLEYQVVDPIKLLYATDRPEFILKNIVLSYIRDTVGMYPVDTVITTGKGEIQAEIKAKVAERLLKQDIGLQIVNIIIQDAEPPTLEVMNAFKNVETAKQDAETVVNDAKKYQNEEIPSARAAVDSIRTAANADKESRINSAKGQVAIFNSTYEEYAKNPAITKQRMFYEAMEEILPGLKVIIDGNGSTSTLLPLESFN